MWAVPLCLQAQATSSSDTKYQKSSIWKSKLWYWIEFFSCYLDLFSIDLNHKWKRHHELAPRTPNFISYSRPARGLTLTLALMVGTNFPVNLCRTLSSLRCSHFVPFSSLLGEKKKSFWVVLHFGKDGHTSPLNVLQGYSSPFTAPVLNSAHILKILCSCSLLL